MADLIDRQAAIDALGGEPIAYTEYEQGLHDKWIDAKENIEALPSTQSEIIRCKECKWYLPNYTKSPFDTDGFNRWGGLANCQNEMGVAECNEEDYCSFGERRES